jgi:hypothetical protein
MRHFEFPSAFLGLALLAACSTSSAPTGTGDPGGDDPKKDPLCATCRAGFGGETGDLTNAPPPVCKEQLAHDALDPDDATLGFAPMDVLPFVEGKYDIPLHWTLSSGTSPAPTGFDEETQLALEVRVTGVHILHRTPVSSRVEAARCQDSMVIDAEITLRTADRALAGRFDATLSADSASQVYGHAEVDLTELSGSLDLHPDSKRPHGGVLLVDLWFLPSELRGSLEPNLIYRDQTDSEGGYITESQMIALWPDDGCATSSRLVASGEKLKAIGGRTVGEVMDDVRALMAKSNPIAGVAADKTEVRVDFELGEVMRACMHGTDFGIQTSLRIETSDGHIATEQPTGIDLSVASDGSVTGMNVFIEGEVLPADDFAKRHTKGLDFDPWPCAEVRLVATWGDGGLATLKDPADAEGFAAGQLEVDGLTCPSDAPDGDSVEYISWCSLSPCPLYISPFW